jgi:LacI family transcriptional regulator
LIRFAELVPRPYFKIKKQLAMRKALRRVAVLVDTSTTWGRAVLRGVNAYSLKQPHRWEIFVEARGTEEHLRVPIGWQGRGIIARVSTPEMARELNAQKLPVVNVSAINIPGAKFPRVATDHLASAKLAAEYFLQRGFKHFAYFGLIGLDYIKAHREMFAETVKASGGDFTWLAVKPMAGTEPDWRLDLKSMGEWLAKQPRPLAVLCWNASSAREIVFACHEVGLLVPEEVAVLSQANDEALCETSLVPISGVNVSGAGIGFQAAAQLDRMMDGKKTSVRPILIAPTSVVTRQSTDTLAVGDAALVKALSYLRSQPGRNLRVSELALQAGVSRRLLERKFLEVLHRTPAEEIRRQHLEHARRLLVETTLPLTQVAELAGFSSQVYFTDVFRRHFAVTPLRYRRENYLTGVLD